jgi:hypothetical protein
MSSADNKQADTKPADTTASAKKVISMTFQVPSGSSVNITDTLLENVISDKIKETITSQSDKEKVKRLSGGNNNQNQLGGLARKSKKSMKKKSLKKKSLRRRR